MFVKWKLNWSDSNYGTGPEQKIAELGGKANGIISSLDYKNGEILGTIIDLTDLSELGQWNVIKITEEEALDFAKSINIDLILENGTIISPLIPVNLHSNLGE